MSMIYRQLTLLNDKDCFISGFSQDFNSRKRLGAASSASPVLSTPLLIFCQLSLTWGADGQACPWHALPTLHSRAGKDVMLAIVAMVAAICMWSYIVAGEASWALMATVQPLWWRGLPLEASEAIAKAWSEKCMGSNEEFGIAFQDRPLSQSSS